MKKQLSLEHLATLLHACENFGAQSPYCEWMENGVLEEIEEAMNAARTHLASNGYDVELESEYEFSPAAHKRKIMESGGKAFREFIALNQI